MKRLVTKLSFSFISLLVTGIFISPGGCAENKSNSSSATAPLGYRLVGTIEGSHDITAATFEDLQTKRQKSYRIGDVIDGATIVEIKNHQVKIRRGTEFLTISISGGNPQEPAPSNRAVSRSAEPLTPEQALGRVLSKQIPPYSPEVQKAVVDRKVVDELSGRLQQYTEKPALFTESPLGKGIRVKDLGAEVAANLGLSANDVIVGISGMGIDSPERLTQIIEILGRAKVFDLTVIHESDTLLKAYELESHP